jgi:hypothetical protein
MNKITTELLTNDGAVDRQATLEAFETQLDEAIDALKTEGEVVGEAVAAVFDAHKGERLVMPALINATLTRLNVQPSNYNTLSQRVGDHVRDNADGKGRNLYTIGRGRKAGGVGRIADLPAAK